MIGLIDWVQSTNGAGLAGSLMAWVGQGLIYGTILALATWLGLALVRRRISPALQAVVWSIVLIKFMTPTGPSASFSLASFCDRVTVHYHQSIALLDDWWADDELLAHSAKGQTALASTSPRIKRVTSGWRDPWALGITITYLSCVAVLLLIRLHSYRRFVQQCHRLRWADAPTRRLVEQVCDRLGVRRVPQVRISDAALAPYITGWWRPQLVLSRRQSVRPDVLETVIVHEIAHLRRGDMLVRYVQCLAGTLLFFWPVVAWVNRRIDEAREHACDQWALRHGKLGAGDYARCLLEASVRVLPIRLGYRPAFMAANPQTIERRIDMVFRICRESPGRGGFRGILALSLVLAWGGFALAGATDKQKHALHEGHAQEVYLEGPDGHHRVLVEFTEDHQELRERAGQVAETVDEFSAADVDADGSVSGQERVAYLVALAMQMPDVLLEIDAASDRNGDGQLSAIEAYAFLRRASGLSAKEAEMIHTHLKLLMEQTQDKEELHGHLMKIHQAHQLSGSAVDAAERLLDSMTLEPTADEVAEVADEIEQAKRDKYLHHHPEADTDGDGVLTREERDEFNVLIKVHKLKLVHESKIDAESGAASFIIEIAPTGEDAKSEIHVIKKILEIEVFEEAHLEYQDRAERHEELSHEYKLIKLERMDEDSDD